MPDNTGRDARMKKEDLPVQPNKKPIADILTKLMADIRLNHDEGRVIGYIIPATADEPEKFISLTELEQSLENMTLVHEIAINENFKLKPPKPDTLVSTVQKTMRDAYWNLLREELSKDPPCFTMAIQLLLDIKETFKVLLRGNNDRALHAIVQVLDENNIRQLAETHGRALLEHNAQFIMKVMAMACCPARDAEIAALKRETEPFTQLRGIMEVLDNMKLDMANFVMASTRAQFVRYSVEYERNKFGDLQMVCGENFPATIEWLKRFKPATPESEEAAGGPPRTIQLNDVQMPEYFIDAYQEYLQPDTTHPFPELLKLDYERFGQLKDRAMRMCTCTTVMQLTCANATFIATHSKRNDLAAKLVILSMDYPGKIELKELLESLWMQVLVSISDPSVQSEDEPICDTAKVVLKNQILAIDCKMSVYSVVWRKLMTFMKARVMADTEEGVSFRPIFYDYHKEAEKVAGLFKRIVTHNFEVYGNFYLKSMREC